MQNRLFPIHRQFPDEMAAAGRILLDYGEIEIDLMNCVNVARNDLNTTLKTMFRTRGEKQRIEIADALGRSPYRDLELGTQFETAIADMQHCRKIRNQYAHAYWHSPGQRLCFVGLEDLARSHDHVADLTAVPFYFIDMTLLTAQEKFLAYTQNCLLYLNWEGRYRARKLPTQLFPVAPQQLARPALHILPEKETPP